MSKLTPAEKGWHVVTIEHHTEDTLRIDKIEPVTHWVNEHPMQNGRALVFDPGEICHVFFVSFIMDPQGRLIGWDRQVVANSVMELQEHYARWRQKRKANAGASP